MVKAKFSVVNTYGCHPANEDDVYEIAVFNRLCKTGAFIDDDGYGYLVDEHKNISNVRVKPSKVDRLNISKYTHVIWFNR